MAVLCSLSTWTMAPTTVGGPLPTVSRTGRQMQRYSQDSGARLVAGCIPVRISPDGSHLQVLLITSRGGKGLVFPKGGWEQDEDVQSAAARETVEEAGVRGELEDDMIGSYTFSSAKAARLHSADQGRCVAHMFAMRVAEELPVWPEAGQRRRVWCSVQEASKLCRHDWMREALHAWLRRQGLEHLLLEQPQSLHNSITDTHP